MALATRSADAAVSTGGLAIGFRRNEPVASGIDLDLEGGLHIVVGSNGAGKSTLLRTLATVIEPLSGNVSLCGHDLSSRRGRTEARRHLGYVPQLPDFPGGFTVEEFLCYGGSLRGVGDVSGAIAAAADQYLIGPLLKQPLGKLSGGQRQRCFLAEANLHQPAVLLLDEPTAGLDIPTRRSFLAQLEELPATRCVVLTTHLVEDISPWARSVILVSGGVATVVGSGASLISDSALGGVDLATHMTDLLAAASALS